MEKMIVAANTLIATMAIAFMIGASATTSGGMTKAEAAPPVISICMNPSAHLSKDINKSCYGDTSERHQGVQADPSREALKHCLQQNSKCGKLFGPGSTPEAAIAEDQLNGGRAPAYVCQVIQAKGAMVSVPEPVCEEERPEPGLDPAGVRDSCEGPGQDRWRSPQTRFYGC